MKNIEIKSTGSYLPKIEVNNQQLEKELKLEEGYIEKRTGIEKILLLASKKLFKEKMKKSERLSKN